jgi:hypothetical protein
MTHAIPAHCEKCRHWRVPRTMAFHGWGLCTLDDGKPSEIQRYLPAHKTGYCKSHTPRPDKPEARE